MVGHVTDIDNGTVESSPWSPRERELLAVTLQLLQQHGYDRLTVDAVAIAARASKTTMYRRWPSKAELVLAAFLESISQVVAAPNTGTLRGDLLQLGELVCLQAGRHASTIRAVLVEASRNSALDAAVQQQFLGRRKALMREILGRAVDRGEVDAAAADSDLWDVLPGYLMFRIIIPSQPLTPDIVRALVDDLILPSLG